MKRLKTLGLLFCLVAPALHAEDHALPQPPARPPAIQPAPPATGPQDEAFFRKWGVHLTLVDPSIRGREAAAVARAEAFLKAVGPSYRDSIGSLYISSGSDSRLASYMNDGKVTAFVGLAGSFDPVLTRLHSPEFRNGQLLLKELRKEFTPAELRVGTYTWCYFKTPDEVRQIVEKYRQLKPAIRWLSNWMPILAQDGSAEVRDVVLNGKHEVNLSLPLTHTLPQTYGYLVDLYNRGRALAQTRQSFQNWGVNVKTTWNLTSEDLAKVYQAVGAALPLLRRFPPGQIVIDVVPSRYGKSQVTHENGHYLLKINAAEASFALPGMLAQLQPLR